ncbi:MAG: glycine betaine ABC transporter substrate-binding protein, partial [Solirubrobacteraceae bacterium]
RSHATWPTAAGDGRRPGRGGIVIARLTCLAVAAALAAVVVTGCGGESVTIGAKNFPEQRILGEIYAQALEADGFDVEREFGLGDEKTALKSLETKQIDAYPEYTGTALTSFFGVKAAEIPKDPAKAFEGVRDGFRGRGITPLDPTPFTSSNEVGVLSKTAERLNLRKISDLARVQDQITLFGSPECRQREDCLLGLQGVYGLKLKRFVPVDISLRHQVLTTGQADASIVFTTDPQITRDDIVLLEDDRGMFPPYNSTLLFRDDALARVGGDRVRRVIDRVSRPLTGPVMRELDARVELDKETPAQAAEGYLEAFGLVD